MNANQLIKPFFSSAAALILACVCLVLAMRPLAAHAAANWGWLIVARTQADPSNDSNEAALIQADQWFRLSNSLARNASAANGRAMSNLRLASANALAYWADSALTSDTALYFSQKATAAGEFQQAAVWAYAGIHDEGPDASENRGRFAVVLGQNCQKLLASPPELPPIVEDACRLGWEYWGNLVVNGEFQLGPAGWSTSQQHQNENDFYIAVRKECAGECLCVRGKGDAYHGGWFQTFALPAEQEISLHTKIVVIENISLTVKSLSLEYRNGSTVSAKSQPLTHEALTPGLHVITARVITPEADGQVFRFYPILVSGIGEVCIDAVEMDFQPSARTHRHRSISSTTSV